MSTRIYTMTHKKFNPPDSTTYIPLHVGRASGTDFGYLGDDTGDNISDLNCFYGELTGVYWLWRNLESTDNIGICHYRRFFINDKQELLEEADFEKILQDYDVISSKAIYIDEPYVEYYGRAHNIDDLVEEGEVIRELFPEDYPAFEAVMNGNKHYFGNLMVTSRELFDDYCNWLFTIFAELGNRIDVSTYDDYHKRVFGFLSEQLLLVWVTARRLKVYESRIGITEEKAETKELKLAVGQLLKSGQVTEARQLFYEILKVRPDIRLEHSDLRGEIPLIELILYICEVENQRQIREKMLDHTSDLPELLAHVRRLADFAGCSEFSGQANEYIARTHPSEVALEVIKANLAIFQ